MGVGHWVVCVDKDEERVAVLGGRTPIYEPGLENLVTRSVRQGRFFFSTELAEVVHEVAALFIAVDTPQGDDEAADLSSVGALAGAVMWWAGLLILGSVVYAESGSGWAVLLTALLALATSGALRLLCEQGVEWVYSRDSFRIPTLVIGGEGDRERLVQSLGSSPGAYRLLGEFDLSGGKVDLPRLRETLDETEVCNVILAGAEYGAPGAHPCEKRSNY